MNYLTKYEEWLTDEGLLLLAGWARDGLTDAQIAKNIGISHSTLSKWKKEYSDISDTLRKGKDVVDYEVENALLDKALAGNTTAQMFWLKNRNPGKWKDKPEIPDATNEAVAANLKELALLLNNPKPNREIPNDE